MSPELTRRSLLLGGGALVAGAAVAAAGAAAAIDEVVAPPKGRRVTPTGSTQAGIARPATPQRSALHAVFAVLDPARLRADLEQLGATILTLLGGSSATLPDGPGDLTIPVGLGPGPLHDIDPTLPAAAPMPSFAGDAAIPRSAETATC